MGPRRAAAGTLLLTGIAFYAWPTPEFNHNVAETAVLGRPCPGPCGARWSGAASCWWALVGALGAGGLYAKLTTALLLVTLAAWILWDARARQCLATPGPWIGLAVFVALAAPLAFWLVAHDFAPLQVCRGALGAAREGGGGVLTVFLLNVVLNLAGLLAMLAIAGLIGPRRRARSAGAACRAAAATGGAARAALSDRADGGAAGARHRRGAHRRLQPQVGVGQLHVQPRRHPGRRAHLERFDVAALRRIAICAAAVAIVVVPLAYAARPRLRPLARRGARCA